MSYSFYRDKCSVIERIEELLEINSQQRLEADMTLQHAMMVNVISLRWSYANIVTADSVIVAILLY